MIGDTTYERLILGFSPDISRRILDTARKKSTRKKTVLGITALDQDEVNQAISDPQNASLKNLINTAYVTHVRADRAMISGLESVEEQRLYTEEALTALDTKKRTSPSTAQQATETTNALNQQYKQLNNIQNAFDLNGRQLNDAKNDFNSITSDLKDDWDSYKQIVLQNLLQELNGVLKESNLPDLPSGEVDNLLRMDTWQELLDRFYDTGANRELPEQELERILNLKTPSFDTYFKLKAYLAIRSVHPSRENMGKYLKRLDKVFDRAVSEGEALTQRQNENNANLNQKIEPILNNAKSNEATLSLIEKNRNELLTNVASTHELEEITKRTQARIAEVVVPRPGQSS